MLEPASHFGASRSKLHSLRSTALHPSRRERTGEWVQEPGRVLLGAGKSKLHAGPAAASGWVPPTLEAQSECYSALLALQSADGLSINRSVGPLPFHVR